MHQRAEVKSMDDVERAKQSLEKLMNEYNTVSKTVEKKQRGDAKTDFEDALRSRFLNPYAKYGL